MDHEAWSDTQPCCAAAGKPTIVAWAWYCPEHMGVSVRLSHGPIEAPGEHMQQIDFGPFDSLQDAVDWLTDRWRSAWPAATW